MKSEAYVVYCESLERFIKNGSYGELAGNLNAAKKYASKAGAVGRANEQTELCANTTITLGRLKDTVWVARKVVTEMV